MLFSWDHEQPLPFPLATEHSRHGSLGNRTHHDRAAFEGFVVASGHQHNPNSRLVGHLVSNRDPQPPRCTFQAMMWPSLFRAGMNRVGGTLIQSSETTSPFRDFSIQGNWHQPPGHVTPTILAEAPMASITWHYAATEVQVLAFLAITCACHSSLNQWPMHMLGSMFSHLDRRDLLRRHRKA